MTLDRLNMLIEMVKSVDADSVNLAVELMGVEVEENKEYLAGYIFYNESPYLADLKIWEKSSGRSIINTACSFFKTKTLISVNHDKIMKTLLSKDPEKYKSHVKLYIDYRHEKNITLARKAGFTI